MINEALKNYNFINPDVELIRHNENMTYKISDTEKSYVLRIHNPSEGINLDLLRMGKNKIDLIADEIKLLQYLTELGDVHTQKVELNIHNKPVTMLNAETPITVLEWIEGTTLEDIIITEEIAHKIGVMIGKLHNSLVHCEYKNRYYYNNTLLSKMIEEASKATLQGHFNDFNSKIIIETLSHIRDYLFSLNDRFIIVHADLGKSNLINHNNLIIPIDFSLSGYCIPEMDLASAFSHINNEALNQEILKGYKSASNFEPENIGIEVCVCLQILLFIIIQHNKFASEEWFQDKLNDWCADYFNPLISKMTK